MNKYFALLLTVFVFSISGKAQENLVYNKIQDLKHKGVPFKRHDVFKPVPSKSTITQKGFKNISEVNFFTVEANLLNEVGSIITIPIPLFARELTLELREVYLPQVSIRNQDGKRYLLSEKQIRLFRGCVQGDNQSIVAITIAGNELNGIISNRDGNFNLIYDKKFAAACHLQRQKFGKDPAYVV